MRTFLAPENLRKIAVNNVRYEISDMFTLRFFRLIFYKLQYYHLSEICLMLVKLFVSFQKKQKS